MPTEEFKKFGAYGRPRSVYRFLEAAMMKKGLINIWIWTVKDRRALPSSLRMVVRRTKLSTTWSRRQLHLSQHPNVLVRYPRFFLSYLFIFKFMIQLGVS